MQLILPPFPTYSREEEIYMQHKGQELRWTTKPFSKMNFEEDRAMFKHINGFWASLPEHRQDHIFNVFLKIYDTFDCTDLDEDIDQVLSEEIEELMQEHNLVEIRNWAMFNSDIIFPKPPELPAEFVPSFDKNHTREKTYTVDDYIDLVCMILQLRIMVPIWGKYIARTGKIHGTSFKEYYAFKLLEHSQFVAEEPIKKLYNYIKSVLPASGNKADLLQGISSEEFPLYNLSMIVVRKLCLSDIRGIDPTPVLIRHISRHVMEKAKRIDSNTDTSIRSKSGGSSKSQKEEDQFSRLEEYKIKEEVTRGDIQFLLSYAADPYKLAKTISPGISDEEIATSLKAMKELTKNYAEPAQTLLLMWLIDEVVPAEAVSFMNSIERNQSLCAVSAAYWFKGFHLIAALATATVIPEGDEISISGTDSKGRPSKETVEKLEKLFPYNRRLRGSKVVKEENIAIDEFIKNFSNNTWKHNLSEEQSAILNPNFPKLRRIIIPHNFKEQVAQLVIHIADRKIPSLAE